MGHEFASAGAVPFDVPPGTPGAELFHPAGGCCFEAILAKFGLNDPALARVADIVRAAENADAVTKSPEAAGLHAISLGLARCMLDDDQRLAYGFVIYDGLYRWARAFPD